jgi:polysaccharide biosynthesis/export protein
MAIFAKLAGLLGSIAVSSVVLVGQNTPGAVPQAAAPAQTVGSAIEIPVNVDQNSYEIGAGDVLRIEVWREAAFTATHLVRPDGRITIPLVNDIQASGLTPERLAAQLRQALGDQLQNPIVTVQVLQVNSKYYTISGLFARTGRVPMPSPIRVADAINLAGGFQQWAKQKEIRIIRSDGAQIIKFNYEDYLKGKNLDKNIFLQSGDTIHVGD